MRGRVKAHPEQYFLILQCLYNLYVPDEINDGQIETITRIFSFRLLHPQQIVYLRVA